VSEAASATGGLNVTSMAFNLLFSVLLYIVYGAAYVTLFVVLLVRMVVLWLVIALSPVWALGFVIPKLKDLGAKMDEKFVQTAIAPITIAIPLTIGYILLEVLRTVGTGQVGTTLEKFDMTSINLETSGISDLQSMIVAIAAVAFIWIGVFKAASGTYAEGIVSKIKGGLEGAGKTVAGMWKYAPLIPTAEGGKASVAMLGGQLKAPMEAIKAQYGAGGTAATRVTAPQIQNAKTPQELQQLVARGALEQPGNPRAVLNQLTQWKEKGPHKEYAAEKLGKLKTAQGFTQAAASSRGKLTSEQSQNVARILGATAPYAAPNLGTAPSLTGTRPGAAAPAGTAAPAAAEGNSVEVGMERAQTNGSFNSLTPAQQARLTKWKTDRTTAANNTDPTKKAAELKKVDDQLKDNKEVDLKAAVTIIKSTDQSAPQLKSVNDAATPVKEVGTATAEQKKALGDALKKAFDQLDKSGIKDEAKKKNILTKVVQRGGVTDTNALKNADPEIGKYIA
jgi:hypothetical protein